MDSVLFPGFLCVRIQFYSDGCIAMLVVVQGVKVVRVCWTCVHLHVVGLGVLGFGGLKLQVRFVVGGLNCFPVVRACGLTCVWLGYVQHTWCSIMMSNVRLVLILF